MRVLFVSPSMPRYPFNGYEAIIAKRVSDLAGRISSYAIVCGDGDDSEGKCFHGVSALGRRRVGSVVGAIFSGLLGRPLQTGMFPQGRLAKTVERGIAEWKPDLVDAVMLRVAPSVARIRDLPVVHTLVDSMWRNFESRAARAKGLKKLIYTVEARRCRLMEERIASSGRHIMVVSNEDGAHMRAKGGRVHVIPIGVDTTVFCRSDHAVKDQCEVIFSGNMYYEPNVTAVVWFIDHCWPMIRRERPACTFNVVGNRPPASLVRYDGVNGIRILGRVHSIAEHLCGAKIALAPMQSGSGLQFKVLEALSCSIPVIATPIAMGGFSRRVVPGTLCIDGAVQFGEAVLELLDADGRRRELGAAGRRFVAEEYSWSAQSEKAMAVYEAAVAWRR